MFLHLAHTKLNAYTATKQFVVEVYSVTQILPVEERFSMCAQIRRAALSVHLNLAEGASRKSLAERKRFYEIARGSLIEVDTAIGIAFALDYVTEKDLIKLGEVIVTTFKLLTGLIGHEQPTHN